MGCTLQPKNCSLLGYLSDIGSLQAGSTNCRHCSLSGLNCADTAELGILDDEKKTCRESDGKV